MRFLNRLLVYLTFICFFFSPSYKLSEAMLYTGGIFLMLRIARYVMVEYGPKFVSAAMDRLEKISVAAGYLEPPLEPSKYRVRRQCVSPLSTILDRW